MSFWERVATLEDVVVCPAEAALNMFVQTADVAAPDGPAREQVSVKPPVAPSVVVTKENWKKFGP